MRIGFLFNHDQIHQVAHSLPIALALADRDPDWDIVVATTNEVLRREVVRIIAMHGGPGPQLVRLRQKNPILRGAVKALDGIIPAAKLAVYRDNLDFFRSLDALVVAEKTSAILKTRYGLESLRLIHTRHGAGDRAIGFNKASAQFDFILVAGPKIRDRLVAETGIPPERLAIIGYPKFDLPRTRSLPPKLQGNGKPTVLYNPHVSPHLSSWYTHGRAVLDFFTGNPDYNLIFAPHVMLFERKFVISIDKLRLDWPGRLASRYYDAPNIHIDLGSAASTDMSYTEAADIYLGDVSSQVYEFLIRPRPCIFLNSHRIDYAADTNFAHWAAGEVIDDPTRLQTALARAPTEHLSYLETQRDLFARSIDLTSTRSSERAAQAIRQFLRIPEGAAPATAGQSASQRSAKAATA
ncbi:hypothetical protein [Sphingomonas sp.]|uniref:hypothetical protein n=1 Tax=Sphingomonas sp. TaxID=28214 RepID=UPI00286A35E9|nr:hypothetical protein [Sphingomonas sp.]